MSGDPLTAYAGAGWELVKILAGGNLLPAHTPLYSDQALNASSNQVRLAGIDVSNPNTQLPATSLRCSFPASNP